MWKKNKDIVKNSYENQKRLSEASAAALDMVTGVINKLTKINEEIEGDISEIKANVMMLEATSFEMEKTKGNNEKSIAKFRAMIEE